MTWWSLLMFIFVLFTSMPYILGTLFVLTSLLVDAAFHAAQVTRQAGLILRSYTSRAWQRSNCSGATVFWYYSCICIRARQYSALPMYMYTMLEARRQLCTVDVLRSDCPCHRIVYYQSLLIYVYYYVTNVYVKKKIYGTVHMAHLVTKVIW